MADPRPLTRKELAEFLPSQRSIRAFEKLFDLVPASFEDVLLIAEEALTLASSAKAENLKMHRQIEMLQLQLLSRHTLNIDQLNKRVEMLETLEG